MVTSPFPHPVCEVRSAELTHTHTASPEAKEREHAHTHTRRIFPPPHHREAEKTENRTCPLPGGVRASGCEMETEEWPITYSDSGADTRRCPAPETECRRTRARLSRSLRRASQRARVRRADILAKNARACVAAHTPNSRKFCCAVP